jgi:hypothetical protein
MQKPGAAAIELRLKSFKIHAASVIDIPSEFPGLILQK